MIGNLSKLVLLCAFLAACSGASDRQMYQRSGDTQTGTGQTQQETMAAISPMAAARMSAIRAFGLDENPTPTKLIGLNQFDVKRVLGDPVFVRRDDGVEIWQYKANGCVLDLFLYAQRDGLSVDHSELRGPSLNTAGELQCLKRIILGQS